MAGIRHPARHTIYYLLSKRVHSVKDILVELKNLELPVPVDYEDVQALTTDILRVRQAMQFPVNFEPRASSPNPGTRALLERWRIKDAWRASPFLGAATDVLFEPQVRHQLELLLLSPLSAASIAKRLSQRFELPTAAMNTGVVRAFAHYYWDVQSMDPAQWHKFLDDHYSEFEMEYELALKAPRSEAGAALVIAIADKDPQQLATVHRYETCSSMAFGMFMHHSLASAGKTTKHTYAALAALNMMRMADEELEKHRGGSTDLLHELQRIKTIYDRNQPLQITDATFIPRPVLEVQNGGEDE